jgi:hypothetical protein
MILPQKNSHIVNFSGGLGNQLFQLSFGRYLSKLDTSKNVIYDFRDLERSFSHAGSDIRRLNIDIQKSSLVSNLRFAAKNTFSRQRNRLRGFDTVPPHVYNDLNYAKVKVSRPSFFIGYWQNIYYAQYLKSELERELLQFYNKRKLKRLAVNFNDVACHVRLGDYTTHINSSIYHQFELDDFLATIRKCNFNNKVIYIFSDDTNSIRADLLKSGLNFKFISDYNLNVLEEFVLMSRFHNILISNSTFSWWAAFANYEKKLCIQPEYWFKDELTPASLRIPN